MVDKYKTVNDSQSDGCRLQYDVDLMPTMSECMRGQDAVGCRCRRCRRRRRTYLGNWRSQPESMLFCFSYRAVATKMIAYLVRSSVETGDG